MMSPTEIFEAMMKKDAYSQWLGIELIDIDPGYCKIGMTVRDEMVNGFQIAHGGISFAFADSALAFASNSRGQLALSMHTEISHFLPIQVGDTLQAEAKEINRTRSTGKYRVLIRNQREDLVAEFNGLVFVKKDTWKPSE